MLGGAPGGSVDIRALATKRVVVRGTMPHQKTWALAAALPLGTPTPAWNTIMKIEILKTVAMWTWKRMPLFLAAVTYLCVGATAYYNEKYQTFLRQHHDNPKTKIENTEYCEVLMNYRSAFQSCKPFNVFIHASEVQLQDVCGPGGYPYHGTGKRRSKTYYPITICRLGMMTRARQCVYYAAYSTRRLVLSCDENSLPVHLDEVLTMSG
ncbi:UNVERIFIED_CONTAM: hypothetical protein K2H54_035619 [Gekko kuhli]